MNYLSEVMSHFFTLSNHDYNCTDRQQVFKNSSLYSYSEHKDDGLSISKNMAILVLSFAFVFNFTHERNVSLRHFVYTKSFTKQLNFVHYLKGKKSTRYV